MKELHDFRTWLTILGYSEQRTKQYPRTIEGMMAWCRKELSDLTKQDLSAYLTHLKERTSKEGELHKASYVNSQLTGIKTFAKFLSKTYKLHLPVSHLLYARVEQTPPTVLTQKEIAQLFSATDESKYGYRDRAMLSVCYGGGLRRREAIHLHVRDIDFKHSYIHVREGKNHKERLVPLPPKAMEYLKAYLVHARPQFKKGQSHQRALFLGYRGTTFTAQVFERRIKFLAKRTTNQELISKKVTLHLLRHSIATHLLESGLSIEQVAKFLGHSSLASTQVYTHIETL